MIHPPSFPEISNYSPWSPNWEFQIINTEPVCWQVTGNNHLLMQRDLYVTCERCCHNEGSLSKDTNFNSHINECSISHCYCSSCQCYNKFIKYQQVYFLADTYTSTLLLPLYQSI